MFSSSNQTEILQLGKLMEKYLGSQTQCIMNGQLSIHLQTILFYKMMAM